MLLCTALLWGIDVLVQTLAAALAAWSADGSQVAVFGSTGFYLVGADGSNLSRLGDGYLHAQIDWLDQSSSRVDWSLKSGSAVE